MNIYYILNVNRNFNKWGLCTDDLCDLAKQFKGIERGAGVDLQTYQRDISFEFKDIKSAKKFYIKAIKQKRINKRFFLVEWEKQWIDRQINWNGKEYIRP